LELGLVAVLYIAYDATRGLRHPGFAVADRNGERILRWERSLHLDPETFLNNLLWHDRVLAVLASYDYATLHFIITPAVLIWLYRRHPDRYRPARTALVIGTVTALVIYWYVPTAPPRLLPGNVFHDTLASVHQWGWWGSEGSVPRGFGGLSNQLAAMPSLHVGWALWSGWLIARYARRPAVRVMGALYPVVTALVVMGTGNHYLFDAVGGVVVIAFGAVVTLGLRRRHPSPAANGAGIQAAPSAARAYVGRVPNLVGVMVSRSGAGSAGVSISGAAMGWPGGAACWSDGAGWSGRPTCSGPAGASSSSTLPVRAGHVVSSGDARLVPSSAGPHPSLHPRSTSDLLRGPGRIQGPVPALSVRHGRRDGPVGARRGEWRRAAGR
jgi:hypothetical protein